MPQETSPRKTIGRLLGLKRVLFANLVIFGLVGWGFSGEFMRNREMQQEMDRLQAQADAVESRNLQLSQLSRDFASEDAVEREARLKLNLRKPGEQVVVVQGAAGHEEAAPDGAAGGPSAPAPDEPNYRKWWRYFFK